MSTKVWNLRYVAGNPEMFTAITTAAGGPMRRAEAIKEAEDLCRTAPGWRIWVEHVKTGERIFESDKEKWFKGEAEAKRVNEFAAQLDREAPSYAAAYASASGRITVDDLIARLQTLKTEVGGSAPVVVDKTGGGLVNPELGKGRIAAGGGQPKKVSRQGVVCVVIE